MQPCLFVRRMKLGVAVSLALACGCAASYGAILNTHDASLTDYRAGGSPVQNVQPLALQSALNMDGTGRTGAAWGWSFAGNAGPEPLRGAAQLNAVRLDTGTVSEHQVHLSLPAYVPWVVGISYNLRDGDAAQGHQGNNWFQLAQPEIVFYDDPTDAAEDMLYLVYAADRYAAFKRTGAADTTFRGVNGANAIIQHDVDPDGAGTPDRYTVHLQDGRDIFFFGHDADSGVAAGQLWKVADAAGNAAYAGHETSMASAVTAGFDGSGRLTTAYDSSGRRYSFTYTSGLLTNVVAEEDSGGGSWFMVGEVDYAYYGAGEAGGSQDDLELVTVTTPLSDSAQTIEIKTHYRYWKGAYNASTNPGHDHAIKYIVRPEGYRQADWADASFNDTPLSMSETALQQYADAYFEYQASGSAVTQQKRVAEAWFNGECGCAGGSNGTHLFTYAENTSGTWTAAYDDDWKYRATVERPDGSFSLQFIDEQGQKLSSAVADSDPTLVGADVWPRFVDRNSNGHVITVAAVGQSEYASGEINLASTGTGDGRRYTRFSGALAGFIFRTWLVDDVVDFGGPLPNPSIFNPLTLHEYTSLTDTVGALTLTRAFVDDVVRFDSPVNDTLSPVESSDAVSVGFAALSSTNIVTTSGGIVPETATYSTEAALTDENGDGSTTLQSESHLRSDGTVRFTEAQNDVVAYSGFTSDGQVSVSISDANTGASYTGDFDVSTGLPTSNVSAEHRATWYTYDDQGRVTEIERTVGGPSSRTTLAISRTHYTKLADGRLVTISSPFVVAGSPDIIHGPASYTVTNQAGGVEFSGQLVFSGGSTTAALSTWIDSTDSDPIAAVSVGALTAVSTTQYNETGGKRLSSRLYFDLPASLPGTDGTHYDQTTFAYDDMGRVVRSVSPAGTINRTVFDAIGRPVATWIGTSDTGWNDVSGGGDMTKATETEYDNNSVGPGNVTKRIQHVDASTTRETLYYYDERDRLRLVKPDDAPQTAYSLDFRNRRIATATFKASQSFSPISDAWASSRFTTSASTGRIGLSKQYHDQAGRVYATESYDVDSSDGSATLFVRTDNWWDNKGRLVKTHGSTITKHAYDDQGRKTATYVIAKTDDAAYADADDVTGDHVLAQTQYAYDATSGLRTLTTTFDRHHDDGTSTGALTTSNARRSYSAVFYDNRWRATDSADYGTNGGSALAYPGTSSPPARSDTVLVSSTTYGDDGRVLETTDPRGVVTRTLYDDAGRAVATIANYTAGSLTNPNRTNDLYTRTVYTDGLRTQLWVDLDGDDVQDADDQVTTYVYGITKGTGAADSRFASNDVLARVEYPDSTGASNSDRFAYLIDSRQHRLTDRAGNVLDMAYDDAGRLLHKRATTVVSGYDDRVLRISHAYDDQGRLETVTQYDNAAVGSGSVIDQVKYAYDNAGRLDFIDQDLNSAVDAAGSVDHFRTDFTRITATPAGGWTHNRLTRIDLASHDGTSLVTHEQTSFEYSVARGIETSIGRADTVCDYNALTSVTLASYDFMGSGAVAETTLHTASNVVSNADPNADNSYARWDRFGRVTDDVWTRDNAVNPDRDVYNVQLAYDRASNITGLYDQRRPRYSWALTVDDLNRLTDADQGLWGGSSMTTTYATEAWTLDQLGNFDARQLDLNADGDFLDADELDEANTFNAVNELTARDTDDDGTDDFTLAYNDMGQLTAQGDGRQFVYDAFGRLAKVEFFDGSSTSLVARFHYNGLGHLVARTYDNNDASDTGAPDGSVDADDLTYVHQYDQAWRIVATYRATTTTSGGELVPNSIDASPKEIFVYHEAGYTDRVIRRAADRTNDWHQAADGTEETRTFFLHNLRGDLVATLDTDGAPQEEIRYTPYGVPILLSLADTNGDGITNATDFLAISGNLGSTTLDDEDLDRDGEVDNDDYNLALNVWLGVSDERGALTRGDGDTHAHSGQRKGYAAYEHTFFDDEVMHVRHRVYLAELGRWTKRDPAGYVDGMNVYAYVRGNPVLSRDPMGLFSCNGLNCPGTFPRSHSFSPLRRVRPGDGNQFTTAGATQLFQAEPQPDVPLWNPWDDYPFLERDSSCNDRSLDECFNDPGFQRALALYQQECGDSKKLTIKCEPTGVPGAYGIYCCNTNEIILGPSAPSAPGGDCAVLQHELLHAADMCTDPQCIGNGCGGIPVTREGCRMGICTEARAAGYGHCCYASDWDACMAVYKDLYIDMYRAALCPQGTPALEIIWNTCAPSSRDEGCSYSSPLPPLIV